MAKTAAVVGAIWNLLWADRMLLDEARIELRDAKELYVDVKVAEGVEVAVEELKLVQNDLRKVGSALRKVQAVILGIPVKELIDIKCMT